MNKDKEPVRQKAMLNNFRALNEGCLPQERKKTPKLNIKPDALPVKNDNGKQSENRLTKPHSASWKGAQSVEKMPQPKRSYIKCKSIMNHRKSQVKEEALLIDSDRAIDYQENDKFGTSPLKNASPSKEKSLSKIKQAKKEVLEVVSEENEENFRETLHGVKPKEEDRYEKANPQHSQEPFNLNLASKQNEFILQEVFSAKNDFRGEKNSENESASPLDNKESKGGSTTADSTRADELTCSQKETEQEIFSDGSKLPCQIRGKFMKEHISSSERQKEQDQKKLLKEYLDQQINEKKRLKEEEKRREMEENKKEEMRLKREVQEINDNYGKETSSLKARHHPIISESIKTDLKLKTEFQEDNLEMKRSLSERESFKEPPLSSRASFKATLRQQTFKKSLEEKMETPEDLKKLTEENQQLKDQNVKKNELIDILLTALKHQGKDSGSEEKDVIQGIIKSRSNSRVIPQRIVLSSRNGDNLGPNSIQKNEALSSRVINTSPWNLKGSHLLRIDTDHPEYYLNDPMETEMRQPNTSRATETLSKLINPEGLAEIKLPLITEFYSSKRGFPYLSRSNVQQCESKNKEYYEERFAGKNLHRVSPRNLNFLNIPVTKVNLKTKSDTLAATSLSPKFYGRQIQFSRSKMDESSDVEILSRGRFNFDLESNRVASTLTPLSVRNTHESHFLPNLQSPGTPFGHMTANTQRVFTETKNPITIMDMGNNIQIQTTRNKVYEPTPESKTERLSFDETRDIRFQSLIKERESRLKSDLISIKEPMKSEQKIESDKRDTNRDVGAKKVDNPPNKSKFPKEVFCLNLRKKVAI